MSECAMKDGKRYLILSYFILKSYKRVTLGNPDDEQSDFVTWRPLFISENNLDWGMGEYPQQ